MQDVDKLKKLIGLIDDMIEVGEVVMEDGKLSMTDFVAAPEAVRVLGDLFSLVKDHGKELVEELKDIDFKEGKELIDEVMD